MRSTFFGLQIGKAGLTTSQFGLDVTSHNIANAETAGYTRQRVVQTALLPSTGFGRALPPVSQLRVGIGTGVKIHDQIRSEFLDRRFRTENTMANYHAVRTQEMRYMESFFDSVVEETSINFTIEKFFEAVEVLSKSPVEGAPRTLLRDAGLDLVQQLNMVYQGLIDLQTMQNQAVKNETEEINRITAEIMELNKAIYIYEITGHFANDLRDARNLLLDELSEIIDIEYHEIPDPTNSQNTIFEVFLGNTKSRANMLVSHDKAATLGVIQRPNVIEGEDPVYIPVWFTDVTADYIEQPINFNIVSGGKLMAYVDMRDGTGPETPEWMTGVQGLGINKVKGIPHYIEMLNNLARALVQEVNGVHSKGWTDHPNGSETGINFFHIGFLENLDTGSRIKLNADGKWEDEEGELYPLINLHNAGTFPDGFTLNTNILQITAKSMRLSIEVEDSAQNIAASSTWIDRGGVTEALQRGNNENMRALYRLFSEAKDITLTLNYGGHQFRHINIGSFDGYATSIRHDVASTTYLSINAARNGATLITSMSNQRLSIGGVSLDEEMVSLIRYQHAYSGAARVITAMDDALDRLINGTGRVGL